MWLYVRKIDVAILTPETTVFEQQPILLAGGQHGCCPVRTTGDSLPHGRSLLTPLAGNKEVSMAYMVHRVRPTPSRSPVDGTALT